MSRAHFGAVILSVTVVATAMSSTANAQEQRLVGRLPDVTRAAVDRILDSAQTAGLPTEPMVDRALEGAAKGASGDRIVAAVRRLWSELRAARAVFGSGVSVGELTAGASAIRAGASESDLAELRTLRSGRSLTVAAAVLADLVAVGVPSDEAISAVLTLASTIDDADYMAFRRNVERDIELGAAPAAALGVRLRAAAEMASNADGTTITQPGKRKP